MEVIDSNVSVTKLERLKEWLAQNNFDARNYQTFLGSLDLSPADFHPYYRFSGESYTRNMLVKTDSYELILICWDAGQKSPVHNHGFSQCFVRCLEGSMFENSYLYQNNEMRFNTIKQIEAGDSAFINNTDIFHELGNASNTARAVSLHLYSPRIAHHYIFDKTTGKVSPREF